jgi:hypothetical protein
MTGDSGDPDNCEKLTTLNTYTSEGKFAGKHVAPHGKVVCGIVGSELIFLRDRNYLWFWSGGLTRSRRMGRIDCTPTQNIFPTPLGVFFIDRNVYCNINPTRPKGLETNNRKKERINDQLTKNTIPSP